MSASLTRRAAIIGAAASSVALAVPAVAAVSDRDRFIALLNGMTFKELRRTEGILNALSGKPAEHPDAAIIAGYQEWCEAYDAFAKSDGMKGYKRLSAAERRVVKRTPVTAQGLAIQFVVFTSWGDFEATKSNTHDFAGAIYKMAAVKPPATHVNAGDDHV